jgi:hypothetical protein
MRGSRKTMDLGWATANKLSLGTVVHVERTTERDLESAPLPRKSSGLVNDTNVDVDAWMHGPEHTHMAARE